MTEFEYSLSSLKKFNDSAFVIRINNKEIKFTINENIKLWVSSCKANLINQAEKIREKEFKQYDKASFLLIYYIYKFILSDFFSVIDYIRDHNLNILELGSGTGFFANILFQIFDGKINLNLVEVEKNEDHKSKFSLLDENDLKLKEKNSVYPLKNLKEFIQINQINANIFSPDDIKKSSLKNINFVCSFRSYCFLYEIDEYSDFLKKSMAIDAKIICDVSKKFNQLERFKKEFFYKKTLGENDNFARIYAMKNIISN